MHLTVSATRYYGFKDATLDGIARVGRASVVVDAQHVGGAQAFTFRALVDQRAHVSIITTRRVGRVF